MNGPAAFRLQTVIQNYCLEYISLHVDPDVVSLSCFVGMRNDESVLARIIIRMIEVKAGSGQQNVVIET